MSKSFRNLLTTTVCYIVLFLLTSTYCWAEVFTGTISSSTGGAGRAATETGETLFLNPATIVHAKDFTLGAYFMDGYWSENLHEKTYAVTLIDNHEDTIIPGGLSYVGRKRHFVGIGSIDEMYVQATVAKFIGQFFSLGGAVTYLKQDYQRGHTQWNGHIGVMYTPHEKLGLGFVVQNFIEPKDTVPLFLREELNVGFGATYLFDKYFKMKADVVAYDIEGRDWRGKYMFGAESDISQYLIVRLGYQLNDVTHYKHYTFGFGLKTPRFGLDYSVLLKEGDRRGAMHSVDIRLPL